MLIQSQNKSLIINSNKVSVINATEKGQVGAWFDCDENTDNNAVLGEYETEERAKEILEQIISFYIRTEDQNKIFRMPKE